MQGELLRQEILKCGYLIGEPIEACNYCEFRFKCHSTKLRRFYIREYYAGYDSCTIYANSADEAYKLLCEYGRDAFEEGKSDSWGDDMRIDELDKKYNVIRSNVPINE